MGKKTKIIVIVSSLFFAISLALLGYIINHKQSYALSDEIKQAEINLIDGVDLFSSSSLALGESTVSNTEIQKMIKNTINLQNTIDELSQNGGGIIRLPKGIYYFAEGGETDRSGVVYAIKARNNVVIKGSGINDETGTILMPFYPKENYPSSLPPRKSSGALNMFYFDNIADGKGNETNGLTQISERKVSYIKNDGTNYAYNEIIVQDQESQSIRLMYAGFSDFIIDGSQSRSSSYNTSGKGVGINGSEYFNLTNVLVRYTDATGIALDEPVSDVIDGCYAIGCGASVKSDSNEGGSGFGIGTGYSNNESLLIKNSVSLNNGKFGFFFEHQRRFTSYYLADKADSFVVENSIAGGNMYDFGGIKANYTYFQNCKGISGKQTYTDDNISETLKITTKYPILFQKFSTNVDLINMDIYNRFTDINSLSNEKKDAIQWALNEGISAGVSPTSFGTGQNISRFATIQLLYRLNNRKVDFNYDYDNCNSVCSNPSSSECIKCEDYLLNKKILLQKTENQASSYYAGNGSIEKLLPFTDAKFSTANYKYDLDAVYWAYKKGIIQGTSDATFNPDVNVTTKIFLLMLYRYDNFYKTNNVYDISKEDNNINSTVISWAKSKNIIPQNIDENKLKSDITREDIILYLYNYNKYNSNHTIRINLVSGGKANYSGQTDFIHSSSSSLSINNPTRTGYDFDGWTGYYEDPTKNASFTSLNDNYILTANWTPKTYKITYNANGGTGTMEVSNCLKDHICIVKNNTYTKTDYEFAGWYTSASGGSKITDNTVLLNSNVTYYAHWVETSREYTITYKKGTADVGDVPTSQVKQKNESINLDTNSGANPLKRNDVNTTKSITITYNANGGTSDKTTSTYEKTINQKFAFAGWSTKENPSYAQYVAGSKYSKNENITLYPYFKSTISESNASGTLPSATRAGYTFEGWYTDRVNGEYVGSALDSFYLDKDVTLYAHWKAKTYTVTYDIYAGIEGNTPEPQIKIHDVGLTLVTNVDLAKRESETTSDIIVTYDANGGSTSKSTDKFNKKVTTEYAFAGWSKTPDASSPDYSIGTKYLKNENVTLYPYFKSTQKTTYSSKILEVPTYSNHIFNGWYKEDGTLVALEGENYQPKNDITLKAHWLSEDAQNYTITFETGGGKKVSPITNKAGKIIVLPSATHTGYEFKGWKISTKVYNANDKFEIGSEDITATAIWEANDYAISFDANGGECSTESKNVTFGEKYGSLPKPSKLGYTFIGWYTGKTDGTKITEETNVSIANNHVLYARWTLKSTSTINYNKGIADIGNPPASSPVDEDTGVKIADRGSLARSNKQQDQNIEIKYDCKEGTCSKTTSKVQVKKITTYKFTGWSENKDDENASYTPGQLYKEGRQLELYPIFTSNMSTVSTKETLPTAERENYLFDGWYDSNNKFIGYAGSTYMPINNATYYAHWSSEEGLLKKNNQYNVIGKLVYQMSPNIEVENFESNLSEDYEIKIYKDDTQKQSGYMATGDKVKIYKNSNVQEEYIVSIKGDVDGNGQITSADLVIIKNHLLNKQILTSEYYYAADMNKDNKVNSKDLLAIKKHIMS